MDSLERSDKNETCWWWIVIYFRRVIFFSALSVEKVSLWSNEGFDCKGIKGRVDCRCSMKLRDGISTARASLLLKEKQTDETNGEKKDRATHSQTSHTAWQISVLNINADSNPISVRRWTTFQRSTYVTWRTVAHCLIDHGIGRRWTVANILWIWRWAIASLLTVIRCAIVRGIAVGHHWIRYRRMVTNLSRLKMSALILSLSLL